MKRRTPSRSRKGGRVRPKPKPQKNQKHMPTKKKSHEGEADAPADTPPQRPTGASEDAVIAPEGVTEPTKVYLGDGVTPVPPGEAPTPKPKTSAAAGELFQGFFNLTGNTFHGKEITDLNTF